MLIFPWEEYHFRIPFGKRDLFTCRQCPFSLPCISWKDVFQIRYDVFTAVSTSTYADNSYDSRVYGMGMHSDYVSVPVESFYGRVLLEDDPAGEEREVDWIFIPCNCPRFGRSSEVWKVKGHRRRT